MNYLKAGNFQLRAGNYRDAIELYEKAMVDLPELEKVLSFNICYAKGKLGCGHSANTPLHNDYNKQSSTPTPKKVVKNHSGSERYEGRIEGYKNQTIRGWVIDKLNPEAVFSLKVHINGIFFCNIRNDETRHDLLRIGKSKGQGGFRLKIPIEILDEQVSTLHLELPDNKTLGKLDIQKDLLTRLNSFVRVPVEQPVSVIVPIYNAADDVKTCIERLKKYTSKEVDIILIDDASTDPQIRKILTDAKSEKNIRVFHNAENMGFTRTVNRGIELAGQNDVVLLNSDARVTPRWLQGIKNALSIDARIATVTPMSDRAGAFSAPYIGNENELPIGVSEEEYAVAFRRRSVGFYPTVPTGNGFCMYIRRACINHIGALDADAFPRGYGEENDFCMRARSHGWRNVLDDRTYVFHDRSKSFGEQKVDLVSAGRKVIDSRYPDYKKAISVFSNSPLINAARYKAKQAEKDCLLEEIKPRVLYVISTMTGGTPQTNRDLMLSLEGTIEPWLFRCDSRVMSLYKVSKSGDALIKEHALAEPVDPLTHTSAEYDLVLSAWLNELDFHAVHIRHLAWHSLSLPMLAKSSGAQVVNSFHDFYVLCPTVKLLDDELKYCGGKCSAVQGQCTAELWPKGCMPELKHKWVNRWRDMFSQALRHCDVFVTTSQSAKETILSGLNIDTNVPFHVIEHGRNFGQFRKPKSVGELKGPIKILVPGNIDPAKGGNIIQGLLEVDKSNKLEFHILGKCQINFDDDRVVMHGSYNRDDFVERVNKIDPCIGVVFSVWDETWCHTLTELWASGIPSIVFNYKTVASRISQSGCGWVFDGKDIESLYFMILNQYSCVDEYNKKIICLEEWQKTSGYLNTVQYMSCQYLNLYKGKTDLKDIYAVVCPSSVDQTEAPGSTHVRVWEKTYNDLERDNTYIRLAPEQLVQGVKSGFINKSIIQRTALSAEDWYRIKPYVKEKKLKYIFDIDDDLLNVPKDKDPEGKYLEYRGTLIDIISSASRVTVSTSWLYNKYRKLNVNTILEENKLNAKRWLDILSRKSGDNVRSFSFLYFGSYTHAEDLRMIMPALEAVHAEHPEFKLKVVGVAREIGRDVEWVDYIPIPKDAKNYPDFVEFLKSISIGCCGGLAPLVDNEFNRHKSALKVIEYFALGLPVVASKVGPYADFVDSKWAHVVENKTCEWFFEIKKIIEISKDGGDFSEIARHAINNYSCDSIAFDSLISV